MKIKKKRDYFHLSTVLLFSVIQVGLKVPKVIFTQHANKYTKLKYIIHYSEKIRHYITYYKKDITLGTIKKDIKLLKCRAQWLGW